MSKQAQKEGEPTRAKTPASGKKLDHERAFTCRAGDIILHGGKIMCVAQLLEPGSEAREERSNITACPILPGNFQVLKRSPKYIGSEWRHLR